MFWLQPAPPPLDPALISAYAALEPELLGHVLCWGFAGPSIQALGPGQRVTGRVVTARCVGLDSTIAHEAIGHVEPGDVLVIDSGGELASCWGGGTSKAAMNRGAQGVILNGAVTDVDEILEEKFPVWSRGRTNLTTRVLGFGGALNIPVVCGNAVVSPGDLVLANDSGVVFVSPELARAALAHLQGRKERGAIFEARIAAGMTDLPERSGATAAIQRRMAVQWDLPQLAKE